MALHGAARLRVVDRLERDALDETRLVLRQCTTNLLEFRVDPDRVAAAAWMAAIGSPLPDPTPLESYLPAGRAAANVLEVFVRRISHVEAGLVAR